MRKKVSLLCLSIILLLFCVANIRAVGLEFAEIVSDKAKQSVIPVMSSDGKQIIGTGFLINNKNNIHTFVVTNTHVVAAYFGKRLAPDNVNESSQYLGKNILGRLNQDNGTKEWPLSIIYYDSKIDIAICLLKYSPEVAVWPFQNVPTGYSLFCSSSEIKEGKPIVVIGYPLNLGAEYRNFPVTTIGIIAQSENATNDTFLVDATVNPGNSGSPVFTLDNNKTGIVYVGTVNAYKNNFIKSFDENGQLIALLPYNAGLATVIRAQRIKEIIDSFTN